jgi:RNA polymerase sigma-70 factor (ECF subfamily)
VPPAQRSSEELLGLVALGDEQAFEQLYQRCGATVFGVCQAVLRDPHQAEEVAQEALLEIWRTAVRFDAGRGSAAAWISVIAHRRAVDRVRSAQAARNRDARDLATSRPGEFDEVVERVEARLDVELLRRCLAALTPRQHDAVTLAYYGGHSYPQVAVLLKLPLGTVKTRMRDGLIRLRDCLGVGTDV